MLSMNDRFEINAALERLLADGSEFDPQDAELLIEKVRLSRHDIEISFKSTDESPRDGIEGYAAGRGNFKLEDSQPRTREVGLLPDFERIGGYKLTHRPGRLSISLMWSHTKLELNGNQSCGQSAVLIYSPRTKRPLELRILANVSLEIMLWPKPRKTLCLALERFVPWKKPSGPSGREVQIPHHRRYQKPEHFDGGFERAVILPAAG